jgi:hypothetical protein
MTTFFETTTFSVIIDTTTFSGSCFGATEDGSAVFFNARIVNALVLQEGELVVASCIPNYEDKRNDVPWRCVNASRAEESATRKPVKRSAVEVDQQVYGYMLSVADYCLTNEVAEAVDLDTTTAGNSLNRLFNAERVVKAEVYSRPNLERSSFNLWALTSEGFK